MEELTVVNFPWQQHGVTLFISSLAGVMAGSLVVWFTSQKVIQETIVTQAQHQLEVEHKEYIQGLHALRFETSFNQAMAKEAPVGIRNDAAQVLLTAGQFFQHSRPDLAYLVTVYITDGELVKNGALPPDRYLDVVSLLQEKLDLALEEHPIMRKEMDTIFREVRQIVDLHRHD